MSGPSVLTSICDALVSRLSTTGGRPDGLRIIGATASSLAEMTAPTRALTVTCVRVGPSAQRTQQPAGAPVGNPPPLQLDATLLLAAWGGEGADEQTALLWAMSAIGGYPILAAPAGREGWPTIQLKLQNPTNEELFGVWAALGRPYRLSTTLKTSFAVEPAEPRVGPVIIGRMPGR